MSDATRRAGGEAPADPDPMIGRVLSERYRIESLLARGGMARVYRGRDSRLDREVAIKILSPPYADDAEFTGRFLGEARVAASISHPSLVHVYDSGSDGGAHYIVMELLDRHRSLRQELDARDRLPADEVLRIGRDLLAGLRAVHEKGLVHCDVKPANIMLGPGPPKLIDFGIARTPQHEIEGDTSIGSLHFMSPEQLHGRALTSASDLFSLGVVLYQALTGQVPYPGRTPDQVVAAQAAGNVRPPSTLADAIPGRLDEAILQALRREADQRFDSAEAMGRALSAASDEIAAARDDDTTVVRRVVPTAPPTPVPRGGYVPPPAAERPVKQRSRRPQPPPERASRRSGIWGLLGTLLVLGAAALVVGLFVIPLIQLGGLGPGSGSTPTPAPTPQPGMVFVPQTIGMPTDAAIAAANEAGLNWTVFCNEDPAQPEGIIDQEPPAGTEVRVGSVFSMYSARIADCPPDE